MQRSDHIPRLRTDGATGAIWGHHPQPWRGHVAAAHRRQHSYFIASSVLAELVRQLLQLAGAAQQELCASDMRLADADLELISCPGCMETLRHRRHDLIEAESICVRPDDEQQNSRVQMGRVYAQAHEYALMLMCCGMPCSSTHVNTITVRQIMVDRCLDLRVELNSESAGPQFCPKHRMRAREPAGSYSGFSCQMCALRSIIAEKAGHDTVCGVAFIPVYVYGAGGSKRHLRGRTCVYLGRETSGKYAHQYNLFGGKVEHGKSAAATLLAEIREEMGLIVTEREIFKSLIHVYADKLSGNRRSLMFFVHMTQLNTGQFDEMVQHRRGRHVPHAWREVDKSMHFAVSAHQDGLSVYAQKAVSVGHRKGIFEKVTTVRSISASSLPRIWVPSR